MDKNFYVTGDWSSHNSILQHRCNERFELFSCGSKLGAFTAWTTITGSYYPVYGVSFCMLIQIHLLGKLGVFTGSWISRSMNATSWDVCGLGFFFSFCHFFFFLPFLAADISLVKHEQRHNTSHYYGAINYFSECPWKQGMPNCFTGHLW